MRLQNIAHENDESSKTNEELASGRIQKFRYPGKWSIIMSVTAYHVISGF